MNLKQIEMWFQVQWLCLEGPEINLTQKYQNRNDDFASSYGWASLSLTPEWALARFIELQGKINDDELVLLMLFILIKFAFLSLPRPPDSLQKE